jgi:hypothetical protein
MNTENPTIDEVVAFRDQLLEAREDVLKKFFLLEDLLKDENNCEPEEVADIHDGLREGDRLLKGINDRLAYTHRLMLRFEDLPAEDTLELHTTAPKKMNWDRIILIGFVVVVAIAIIAL